MRTSFCAGHNYMLNIKENFDARPADRFHSTQSRPRGSDAPPEGWPVACGHEGADPLGRRRALGRQPHDLSRSRAWTSRERPCRRRSGSCEGRGDAAVLAAAVCRNGAGRDPRSRQAAAYEEIAEPEKASTVRGGAFVSAPEANSAGVCASSTVFSTCCQRAYSGIFGKWKTISSGAALSTTKIGAPPGSAGPIT